MDPLIVAVALIAIFAALKLGRLTGRAEGRRQRGATPLVIREMPLHFKARTPPSTGESHA